MLDLFKGQLSLSDIMDMPYARLVELRGARVERLRQEAADVEKQNKEMEKQKMG